MSRLAFSGFVVVAAVAAVAGAAGAASSSRGSLVYALPTGSQETGGLVLVDAATVTHDHHAFARVWRPRWIAFSRLGRAGRGDVWLARASGGRPRGPAGRAGAGRELVASTSRV